jgi:hypothetical protein
MGSDELVAGCIVPPGCYVRVDRPTGRRVILERAGPLPASLDGSVAVYERVALLTHELAGVTTRPALAAID